MILGPTQLLWLRRVAWTSCFLAAGLFLFSGMLLLYRSGEFSWEIFAAGLLFLLVPIFMTSVERKLLRQLNVEE